MFVTDSETKPDPGVTLEELDEILDRITATSSFSSIDLRKSVEAKYTKPIRTHNVLSTLFRRLHNSEVKWMIRILLKIYSPAQVPKTLII